MELTSHHGIRASVYESSPQECCLLPFPTFLNIARVCYVPALSLLLLLAFSAAVTAAVAVAVATGIHVVLSCRRQLVFSSLLSLRVP